MLTADLSVKPYLVRAIYEWCVDNKLTPHLTARAAPRDGVTPNYADLATDGAVIFNISDEAVRNILVGNEGAAFTARFGGVTREIRIEMADIAAIFARETGRGLIFPEVSQDSDSPPPRSSSPSSPSSPPPGGAPPARKKPKLRVV